jgi:hypothetical protein
LERGRREVEGGLTLHSHVIIWGLGPVTPRKPPSVAAMVDGRIQASRMSAAGIKRPSQSFFDYNLTDD